MRTALTIVLAGAIAACGGNGAPDDAATNDSTRPGTDAARDDVVVGTDVPAADVPATTDVPAAMDAPPTRDVPVATDVPATRDVLTLDVSGGSCTLPGGGTCPVGTTCPAGDGCNTCVCPAAGGRALCTLRVCPADASTDGPTRRDAGGGGRCTSTRECRLYESYCSDAPCACIPLGAGEPDPPCRGTRVTCFVAPCLRRSADCDIASGMCVVGPTM
jgi:hypothetical protein